MKKFDYFKNPTWGSNGWLNTANYYNFWGNIYKQFDLNEKIVIDIGAGNGRIWDVVFETGLKVKELHLVDPVLQVSSCLQKHEHVVLHKKLLKECVLPYADIAIFKQSFHHLYQIWGKQVFDLFQAETIIIFCMPPEPLWPLSPVLRSKYDAAYSKIDSDLLTVSKKKNYVTFLLDYPVSLDRSEWCSMLASRFFSTLHDCTDEFIQEEIRWANENLPDKLRFSDRLMSHALAEVSCDKLNWFENEGSLLRPH